MDRESRRCRSKSVENLDNEGAAVGVEVSPTFSLCPFGVLQCGPMVCVVCMRGGGQYYHGTVRQSQVGYYCALLGETIIRGNHS